MCHMLPGAANPTNPSKLQDPKRFLFSTGCLHQRDSNMPFVPPKDLNHRPKTAPQTRDAPRAAPRLLFLRLLGPPVPGTDPLAPAAAAAAAARAAQLEPPELLRAWPLLARLPGKGRGERMSGEPRKWGHEAVGLFFFLFLCLCF